MTDTMVDHQTVAAFARDGAVALRGLFADWVEPLRRGIAQNMAEPGQFGKFYVSDEGGRFLTDYCNWQRIDAYRDFIFSSGIAVAAQELMQSQTVQLFHEHVLVKEAQTGIATPWHQDLPYYCVDCPQTVSFWLPLDTIPRDRTLEFVRGSHQWGKLFRPQRFNGQALNENDGMDPIPNIDRESGDYDIIGWALEPGDAVAFDYRIIHGAPPNNSASAMRRAFSLRLLGDEARFVRRPGMVTSPPFPDVDLAHGDLLAHPAFPALIN